MTTAAGNHDTSVVGRITAAAAKSISLFAQSLGIRILASKGKVEIQAQGDEMELDALRDVTIKSSTGKVLIAAPREIILNAGSDYVRIGNGSIEIASKSVVQMKTAVVQKMGPAAMVSTYKTWHALNARYHHFYEFRDYADRPHVNREFVIHKTDGAVFATGRTDGRGRTPTYHFDDAMGLTAYLKEDDATEEKGET